jgi:hypothetical protein
MNKASEILHTHSSEELVEKTVKCSSSKIQGIRKYFKDRGILTPGQRYVLAYEIASRLEEEEENELKLDDLKHPIKSYQHSNTES